jgi:hypothetical protein
MVRKLCLRWNKLEPLALGKIGLIGLKSGPLFQQNSKKLDKHSLWTSRACLPKTEVLEQLPLINFMKIY